MSQENKVKTANLDPLPMCAEHGCLHVHYIYNIQFILLKYFQRTIAITLRITTEIHFADSAMCLSKHLILNIKDSRQPREVDCIFPTGYMNVHRH